jgi:AcrR family transcriptional regulator
MSAPPIPLREQQLKLREDAILAATNTLLAEKGYDAMTIDEVAARIGIAKTSLYRHFSSKEALAAAAMVRLLERAQQVIDAQPAAASPREKLGAVLRWALGEQLAGRMPKLPSTSPALRDALMQHGEYVSRLLRVSEALGAWIEQAQARGELAPELPVEVVLYTLYARTCDPVTEYLKASGNYDDERIVELMLTVTFEGLAARGAKRASAARTAGNAAR